MSARDLVVKFGGKVAPSLKKATRQVQGSVSRTAKSVESRGKRIGGVFGRLGGGIKGFAGPLLALAGVQIGAGMFSDMYREAREAENATAATAAIIKATGGAAKVSASHVGELANSISNKIGVDDELIQNSANLLLTFKNVRNEAGQGAAIFDRATAAAHDMSAAGFGDAAGSAKMLGKALNDPLTGITALGRAGVTFTKAQQKKIKSLVKEGKVLEAQKIIMAEVEGQVGGVAAAQVNAGDKAKVAWGNFLELVGAKIVPVIDRLATIASEKVIPALSNGVEWLADNWGRLGEAFAPIVAFGEKLANSLAPGFAATNEQSSILRETFERIAGFVTGTLMPVFAGWAEGIRTNVVPAILGLAEKAQEWAAIIVPIISDVVRVVTNKFAEWAPTLSAMGTQWAAIIGDAFRVIQGIVSFVLGAIKLFWDDWGGTIMSVIGAIFDTVVGVVKGAMDVVHGIVRTVMSVLRGDWKGAWDGIVQILKGVWGIIKSVFIGAFRVIGALVSNWARLTVERFEWLKRVLSGVVSAVTTWVVGRFRWLKGALVGAVAGAVNWVSSRFAWLKRSVVGTVSGITGFVTRGFRGMVNGVTGLVGRIAGAVRRAFSGLKGIVSSAIRGVIDWVNGKISAVNGVVGKIGLPGIPLIPRYHTGGAIPGRGEKVIIAQGGEGVVSRAGMKRLGADNLDALNSGRTRPLSAGLPAAGTRRDDPLLKILGELAEMLERDREPTVVVDGASLRSMIRSEARGLVASLRSA